MIRIEKDYSLLPHNTFGLDVHAKLFIEYRTVQALKEIIARGLVEQPFLHIGEGSNLLFTKNYEGVVLHSRIEGVEVLYEDHKSIKIKVGAGVNWDKLVAYTVDKKWYGAENLSLIPGEVGAAAVQNIGAYGVEVKDLIQEVHTIDAYGNERTFTLEECAYSYRYSIFKEREMKHYFVTHVILNLQKEEQYHLEYGSVRKELEKHAELSLANVRKTIIEIRKSKLPDTKEFGNAGSFFTNPIVSDSKYEELTGLYEKVPHYKLSDKAYKIPAAWLIDQAGWKGKSRGRAGVHKDQALVLINLGGAKGDEIVHLSQEIQASVLDKFGIPIAPEVNFI